MRKKKLQIGIIGTGMIGRAHMNNFRDDPRTEIRWVAELNAESLAKAAEEYGVPNATRNHKTMLRDPELDAVAVCTPPFSHCKLGMDVMRADKHLIMEKPLAATLPDARKMLAESKKHRGLMITGCSCRHARLNPKFAYVKRLIQSGKLGRVYHVHHRTVSRQRRGGVEFHPDAKWFINRKLAGGGPIYDWGVYDISFHLGVLGEPKFIGCKAFCVNGLDRVEGRKPVFTVEEHGAAFMEFEGGLTYYWERACNAHCNVPNSTTIYGTKAGIRFTYIAGDDDEIEFFDVSKNGRGKARSRILKVNLSHHRTDMYHLGQAVINALAGKGPAPMPWDIEVKNLEILHKIYKTARW